VASNSRTSSSVTWWKSSKTWPTASNPGGIVAHTTSSASSANWRHADSGPTGGPYRAHRGEHARAGGDPVVDENHRVTRDVHRGTPTAVGALAAVKFLGFAIDGGLQLLFADAEIAHQAVVDHHATAGGDRTHREFLPLRHTELAHEEDVKGRLQGRRDLPPDGHAATRQAEHQQVVLSAIGRQLVSQDLAGFSAVPERAPRISAGEPAPSAHRDLFRYRGHIQRTSTRVF
jgi:hypothetical protein